MYALRKLFIRVGLPLLSIVGFFMGLGLMPEMFPDHDVVSDAIYDNDVARVRALLDKGADPNSRSGTLSTVVKMLSRTGSAKQGHASSDFSERTPLLIEDLRGQKDDIARLLIERGADVNARDQYDKSPLDWAQETGSAEMAALLTAKGAR